MVSLHVLNLIFSIFHSHFACVMGMKQLVLVMTLWAVRGKKCTPFQMPHYVVPYQGLFLGKKKMIEEVSR